MKNLTFLFLLPALMWACSSNNSGYKISGELTGLDDSVEVFLKTSKDGNTVTVDSTYAQDGKFVFSGSVEQPSIYYLQVGNKRGSLLLFMENAQMKVTGNADSLWLAKAEGSAAQDTFNTYREESSSFDEASATLYQQWRNAQATGDEALVKKVEDQYDSLFAEKEKFDSAFIITHGNTLVAPYLLRGMAYDMKGDEMEKMIRSFDPSLQQANLVVELTSWADAKKRVTVGQPAVDFTLNDTSGNPVTLSSLYGNYILIDFWAAWCGPCRRENPNVVAAYQEYHPKGFDIIGVSLDRNKADWIKAIEDDHLTWTHVSDLKYWNSKVPKLYGVRAIPANFLLDKDGIIIGVNLRGEELKAKLSDLLD
ncbi:MAG: AhpC/TSA family protein [Chlorobi bacterium]|nr:AhpC/TSA family protein [Chlorobiota bacterium]